MVNIQLLILFFLFSPLPLNIQHDHLQNMILFILVQNVTLCYKRKNNDFLRS